MFKITHVPFLNFIFHVIPVRNQQKKLALQIHLSIRDNFEEYFLKI